MTDDNVEDLSMAASKAAQLSALLALSRSRMDAQLSREDSALLRLAADLAVDVACALERIT